MKKQGVIIKTKSGEDLWGYIMLEIDKHTGKSERLQDVVNDHRTFVPFFQQKEFPRDGDTENLTIISKDTIARIQERGG